MLIKSILSSLTVCGVLIFGSKNFSLAKNGSPLVAVDVSDDENTYFLDDDTKPPPGSLEEDDEDEQEPE